MKYIDKFRALSLEKQFLVLFFLACLALPLAIAHSPLEIISHSFPLFVYFHAEVGHWLASGKSFWQVALACYGVSSVELLGWYFGGFGIRILLEKAVNWIRKNVKIPLGGKLFFFKENKVYQKMNSFAKRTRERFAEWLNKQSVWILLAVLLFPLPFTDIAAATALGAKKVKYGHWYLVAINLPHIFLVVALIYWGVNLFFL